MLSRIDHAVLRTLYHLPCAEPKAGGDPLRLLMQFKVTYARYWPERRRLEFTASGERNGCVFTVVTEVTCVKAPATPEHVHLVALARLTEIFRQRSASGH